MILHFFADKAALRIISTSSYNDHTETIFKKLKILPLPKLTEFFRLQFFQQFKQGLLPSSLKNIWSTNFECNPDRLYRLRNDDDIRLPTSRLNQFNNFPLYSIPPLWSAFDQEDIKIHRNPILFNNLLKQYLLSKLDESYQCSRLLCPHCHLNLNLKNLQIKPKSLLVLSSFICLPDLSLLNILTVDYVPPPPSPPPPPSQPPPHSKL